MPPKPTIISMIIPPPKGTPQRSICPGLAISDNAVIAPNKPVVISSAWGTSIGLTFIAKNRRGAVATPDNPVNAAKRPTRSA
eukprot:1115377-Prymnesium_polylepis.2